MSVQVADAVGQAKDGDVWEVGEQTRWNIERFKLAPFECIFESNVEAADVGADC